MKYLTAEMLSNAIAMLPPPDSVEQRFWRANTGFKIHAKAWESYEIPNRCDDHFIEFEKTPDGKEWCLVCQSR